MSEQQAVSVQKVLRDDAERPRSASGLSASLTFGWRALLKIKHVPEQLFDVTIFPVMMTLLFTFLFGGALAGSVEAYVQFLIPGVFVQTIIMITMYTGLTLNKDIAKGVFDRFRSLPIWRPAPLVGALLGDLVRYSIAAVIVLALGFLLGFRPAGGFLGIVISLGLLLVFAFCMSWMWTMVAMLVRTEQAVMGVSMFLLMPLVFGSNIFVDPATMPGWLQSFVGVNPISTLVTAVRDLMAGQAAIPGMAGVFGWSAVFLVVFGPITMWLYNRKS